MLYDQEIGRLRADTRYRLNSLKVTEMGAHAEALGIATPWLSPETFWSAQVGMQNSDVGFLVNPYLKPRQNESRIENYVIKMANLRFLVEVIGGQSISTWSMNAVHRKDGLPFLSTPLDDAWNFLLKKL